MNCFSFSLFLSPLCSPLTIPNLSLAGVQTRGVARIEALLRRRPPALTSKSLNLCQNTNSILIWDVITRAGSCMSEVEKINILKFYLLKARLVVCKIRCSCNCLEKKFIKTDIQSTNQAMKKIEK